MTHPRPSSSFIAVIMVCALGFASFAYHIALEDKAASHNLEREADLQRRMAEDNAQIMKEAQINGRIAALKSSEEWDSNDVLRAREALGTAKNANERALASEDLRRARDRLEKDRDERYKLQGRHP